MTTPEGMPERIWAALDLLHEIKAQLRTHVEFDHATRLMAAVGDMAEAARAYLETALSSPPAIDLAEMKRAYLAYQEECEGEPQDYKKPFIQGAWSMADWLAATGKLGGDDLGELLQDGFKGLKYSFVFYKNGDEVFCTITDRSIAGSRKSIVCNGKGTTPAEAVRKAMEKMEEGE